MSTTVRAKGESGELVFGEIIDSRGVIEKYSEKYFDTGRQIGFVDPHGDTMMNFLQIRRLFEEINEMINEADSEDLEVLNRLRTLAVICLEEPHRYLWFYGD